MAYMFKPYPTFITEIVGELSSTETTSFEVADIADSYIPPATAEDPQLLTLVDEETDTLETIMYTGKDTANNLVTGITRGIEGEASTWPAHTNIGRYHTAEEHQRIIDNIDNHSINHENTGIDEINVAGLSGELSDNQPPKIHDNTAHTEDYITDYTNNYVNSVTGDGDSTLTLGREGLTDLTQNLSHNHDALYDDYSSWTLSDGTNTTAIGSGNTATFADSGLINISESAGTITVSTDANNYSLESHGNAHHDVNYTDYDSGDFDTDFGGKSTDDLSEGTTNEYFKDHNNTNHTETYATTTGTYAGLRAQSTTNDDVGLGNVNNVQQAESTHGINAPYEIQKDGTDGNGIINFKTS